MRICTLTLLGCLIATTAAADEPRAVWTKRGTALRVRPGESAALVVRAEPGDELTVLGSRGRWLRVRRGRRVGWVTRSQVDDRARPVARRRAQRTGFLGKPVGDLRATVAIDRVRGFDDPRTKARAVLDLVRGDEVTVVGGGQDGWILVDAGASGVGWIPAASVTDGPRFARDAGPAPGPSSPVEVTMVEPERARAASPRGLAATVVATAGAQTFEMQQTGPGGNAAVTARGPIAALGAAAGARVHGEVWLGASADLELGTADLVYSGNGETVTAGPSRALAVDIRAEVAWVRGWRVTARGGYHRGSLTITSERPEPMLVGEELGGVTVGVGGAVPLGGRAALAAAIDVMPAGVQRPAELPPGSLYATGVRAAWLRATGSMRLPAHLVAAIAYRGGLTSAELTDGAATPTTATRTDLAHSVTAGLGVTW